MGLYREEFDREYKAELLYLVQTVTDVISSSQGNPLRLGSGIQSDATLFRSNRG